MTITRSVNAWIRILLDIRGKVSDALVCLESDPIQARLLLAEALTFINLLDLEHTESGADANAQATVP